ncbi:enoyl-CoA hydratase/isomerase family protein [Xanthobacteraceae bacterium A53D]
MTIHHFETTDGIATITFDMPGKVNVMNDAFIMEMEVVVARLQRERDTLRGIIITSAKETFFAGGDLSLMGRARPGQEAELVAHFERLKAPFRTLESLGLPVVAALNGSALGGGYELSLACHHRIALRKEGLVIALPEVRYGILPGAGGVIRLTRQIGLLRALDYLLSGRRTDVETALNDGLIDAIADTPDDLMAQARAFILANPHPKQIWDREDAANTAMAEPGADAARLQARAIARIVALVADSQFQAMDRALQLETEALSELLVSPEAAELIARFFAERSARARPPSPRT